MSNLHAPNLIYPAGGENITSPIVHITWSLPATLNESGGPVWLELFFDDDYSHHNEPNWTMIANLPSDSASFSWRVPQHIYSDKARIGIRTRDSSGQRSEMNVSSLFSINRVKLEAPVLVTPKPGSQYDQFIKITVASRQEPKRNYYHFYYSSDSQGIPRTTIAQWVPSRSLPFTWETFEMAGASDYKLYAVTVDRNGNTSDIAVVDNIKIAHSGRFTIDTKPPELAIEIQNNEAFTNQRETVVNVYSYDQTTDVHALQLKEIAPDNPQTNLKAGNPQPKRRAISYTMSSGDGIKYVQVNGQDYGANIPNLNVKRLFLDAMLLDEGTELAGVTSGTIDGGIKTYAVTSGDISALYEIESFPRRLASIEGTPTAVAIYNNMIYVATVDGDGASHIYQNTLEGMSLVEDFEEPLGGADSSAVDIQVWQDKMYLGLQDGRFLEYDGADIEEIYRADESFRKLHVGLFAICGSLYNSNEIIIYNGEEVTRIST